MASKKKRAVIKRTPATARAQRGRVDRGAMFPVPPPASEAPPEYAAWLADLKSRIHRERLRVVLASNAAMVMLYWDLGRSILDKQADQDWGSRVIDRLAADLRVAFPEMKGFSPRNLKYMRAFAAAWPERQIVQASLAQLTWYHQPYADYIVFSPPAVANFWRHRKVPQPAAQIRFASKAQPPIAFLYGLAAICQEHGRLLAGYSFAGIDKPIGISTYALKRALPRELRSALPTVEEIEAELSVEPQRRLARKKA